MIGLQMPADRLEVMLVQDTSTESSCNVGLSLSALRDWKILLQGIVGEGYTRVLAGETHLLPNDGTFYGNPAWRPATARPRARSCCPAAVPTGAC